MCWITSIHGYVSAVRDNLKPGFMRLRFRTKAHAENFARQIENQDIRPTAPTYEVEETPPPADYRWKFSVPMENWLQIVADIAEEAGTYDNFKGACQHSPEMSGHWPTLHEAWAVWQNVQNQEVARPVREEWEDRRAFQKSIDTQRRKR